MPIISQNIGRLPTFHGEYTPGTSYKRLHRVTYKGSEFQAKYDGTLQPPFYLTSTFEVVFNPEWQVISDATAALVASLTSQRFYITSESKWAAIMDNPVALHNFARTHPGWLIATVEDGFEPDNPELLPQPPVPDDSSSAILDDNTLILPVIESGDTAIFTGAVLGSDNETIIIPTL